MPREIGAYTTKCQRSVRQATDAAAVQTQNERRASDAESAVAGASAVIDQGKDLGEVAAAAAKPTSEGWAGAAAEHQDWIAREDKKHNLNCRHALGPLWMAPLYSSWLPMIRCSSAACPPPQCHGYMERGYMPSSLVGILTLELTVNHSGCCCCCSCILHQWLTMANSGLNSGQLHPEVAHL